MPMKPMGKPGEDLDMCGYSERLVRTFFFRQSKSLETNLAAGTKSAVLDIPLRSIFSHVSHRGFLIDLVS